MKVYLFNVENGMYAGEDFCDAREALEDEGMTAMPPPEHRPGHIFIYDRTARTWELVPAAVLRNREKRND